LHISIKKQCQFNALVHIFYSEYTFEFDQCKICSLRGEKAMMFHCHLAYKCHFVVPLLSSAYSAECLFCWGKACVKNLKFCLANQIEVKGILFSSVLHSTHLFCYLKYNNMSTTTWFRQKLLSKHPKIWKLMFQTKLSHPSVFVLLIRRCLEDCNS